MGASQVVLIGLLMQLCAVVSSITAPRVQRRCGFSNLGLLVILVLLAQILPLYACLGLILPYGGLRTPAEMYVAAAWFGTVSLVTNLFSFPNDLVS
jgi:UMF1 family MFS transporter